jgi:hypothetical protein
MGSKVFLAAVAQPDAELLGNFILLGWRELVVKLQCPFSFLTTTGIIVSLPQLASGSDAATGFFKQGIAFERGIGHSWQKVGGS